MTIKGSTSVSGQRVSGGSRRGDTRRETRRRVSFGWTVHIFILVLAVLLWWIARDMVSVTKTLNDAGRVRIEVSEELKGKWRVLSDDELPVTLEVAGPTKEINDFASELDQSPGRFAYLYEVTASDIENLRVNSRHQVTLNVDIRKFEPTGEAVVPPELNVRPVLSGEAKFEVVLEKYISRPARIDLGDDRTGDVQVQNENGQLETWSFEASEKLDSPIEVYGPASLVDTITDSNGIAHPKVSIDAAQMLKNLAETTGKTMLTLVSGPDIISTLPIVPTPLVEVREVKETPEGETPIALAQVPIAFHFSRLQNYENVSGDFPVNVVLPNWLARKGARVENLKTSLQVDMKVLRSQINNFNANHVKVLLNLSSLKQQDVEIESIDGTNQKRIVVTNAYYSLDINTERLTYKFASDLVTPEQYLPISEEIRIVWTE
jgi:hypothetical protein